jgi:hypothetical protein
MVALKLAHGVGGKWYQLMAFSPVAPPPKGRVDSLAGGMQARGDDH